MYFSVPEAQGSMVSVWLMVRSVSFTGVLCIESCFWILEIDAG